MKMRTLGLCALLLTTPLTIAKTYAKDIPTGKPERYGFSSERLERINTHMEQAVTDGVMVGAMGVIARDGKVVFRETWGQADREQERPMTEDTIFRIYSMSKPITSVALMMLYEQGKFELDDPIGKYIPQLANLEVALSTADSHAGGVSDGTVSRSLGSGDESLVGQTRKPRRQPTIHDLLRHTAGFTYGSFGTTEVDKLYREAGFPLFEGNLEAFVTKLGEFPLQYEPGTRWHYSVAVAVQSRLIEVLSGMRFSEYLDQHLFGPLDMRDAGFKVPEEDLPRFAQMYAPEGLGARDFFTAPTSNQLVVAQPFMSRSYIQGHPLESGGISMVGTSRDYLRFAQMLLNGGELDGVRILSPKTVQFMTQNHLGDVPMGLGRTGSGFGLGFAVVLSPADAEEVGSVGEYGWGGAAGTTFWVDPVENLVGIFMVQSLPHRTNLRSVFKQLSYGALVETKD